MLTEGSGPRSLEQWCQDYLAAGPDFGTELQLLDEVKRDELDHGLVEEKVIRAVQATSVSQGFCAPGRDLFSSFPSHEDGDGAADWTGGVACIDAGARCGCRFCCLVFTCLRREKNFDLWHKIESRLTENLPSSLSSAICIALDEHLSRRLVVSPPGRRVRSEPLFTLAVKLESEVVSPFRTHQC